ncbi:unnamed protein product [Linum trigynum]|uniref:DUF4216 domain-containing protein n=1 Tax=Linum trigynum TaxID=586398 RepID=A0AAV2EVR3_9ROSI
MHEEKVATLHPSMLTLSREPDKRVLHFTGYCINGFRFHTRKHEATKTGQNSGVMVQREDAVRIPYYGVIKDIIELRYTEGLRVVLFECEWYDTTREGLGYMRDGHSVVTLNTTRKCHADESYVMASQTLQVYYVQCVRNRDWYTVIETRPINFYNLAEEEEILEEHAYQ